MANKDKHPQKFTPRKTFVSRICKENDVNIVKHFQPNVSYNKLHIDCDLPEINCDVDMKENLLKVNNKPFKPPIRKPRSCQDVYSRNQTNKIISNDNNNSNYKRDRQNKNVRAQLPTFKSKSYVESLKSSSTPDNRFVRKTKFPTVKSKSLTREGNRDEIMGKMLSQKRTFTSLSSSEIDETYIYNLRKEISLNKTETLTETTDSWQHKKLHLLENNKIFHEKVENLRKEISKLINVNLNERRDHVTELTTEIAEFRRNENLCVYNVQNQIDRKLKKKKSTPDEKSVNEMETCVKSFNENPIGFSGGIDFILNVADMCDCKTPEQSNEDGERSSSPNESDEAENGSHFQYQYLVDLRNAVQATIELQINSTSSANVNRHVPPMMVTQPVPSVTRDRACGTVKFNAARYYCRLPHNIPTLSPFAAARTLRRSPLVGFRYSTTKYTRFVYYQPKMDYDMRLITEVRQHPELYDNTHERFKCKDAKQEIWSRIAFQLRQECDDESVRLVKMRWKSLRDSYVKESKNKNALTNGDKKPRRNWRYAQAMDFLAPYLGPSNPMKGIRRKMFIQTANGLEEIEPVEKYFVTPEDLKEVSEDGGSNISVTSEWAGFSPQTEIMVSPIDVRDDIDSFFQGIADTVKKLRPENQVQIQRDIVNMVLDVKLKEVGDKESLDSS